MDLVIGVLFVSVDIEEVVEFVTWDLTIRVSVHKVEEEDIISPLLWVLLETARFLGGVLEEAGWDSRSEFGEGSADLSEVDNTIFVAVNLVEGSLLGSLTLSLEWGLEFFIGELVVLVSVEDSETKLDSLPFKISECWAFNWLGKDKGLANWLNLRSWLGEEGNSSSNNSNDDEGA